MRRSTPTRLIVPAIDLDTRLIDLGLEPDGSLQVPSSGFPAGWFTGAPTPGEIGPAVIAGHVHWQGRWGVFRKLDSLERGDTIEVDRSDDSTAVFRVTRTEEVPKDAFPTKQVYGNIQHAGLRLITCGGLDPVSRTYEANVIVFADLIKVRSS
jgi:LPXTG-site transpeptidase (sortase) family protein